MKNIIFTLLVLLLTNFSISAQTWTISQSTRPDILQYAPDWGNDILVSNTEPFGKLTGVAKANGTLYLAVPDTAIQSGKSIIIFKSTNNGNTWTNFLQYSGTAMPQRSKMVRSGLDSVYYFYLLNNIIYCLNVESSSLGSITTTTYRDFDAVASSTGAVYVVADALTSTSIPRYASINGFATISQSATVSTGSFPRTYMSGNGDTLILTFYQSTGTDTLAGTIRQGRYRESSPGQLSSIAFLNVITDAVQKPVVQPVFYGGKVWMIYSIGTTGALDIKCMLSTNSGLSYGTAVDLAANPNVDEYWFEARHYTAGTGGLDIAYYADSLQSGNPTNNTDKMLYKYANLTTPTTFPSPVQFSEHAPGWSARMYIPAMVEIYNTSDVGVAWVGLDGTNKRIYWDRYSAVVGIPGNQNEIPQTFILNQNYPNPFNPVTKIEFSIPFEEFVSLKVFDILGREVAVPVSKNMKAGKYTVDFDASKLSSGVYIYRIEAGRFTDAKKMILIK